MAYLDLAAFKTRTVMPSAFVDEIEAALPGWTDTQLTMAQGWIDARLRKRYAVPFVAPVPEIVLGWLTSIVTWSAWQRRGYDPEDQSIVQAKDDALAARNEVKEAADAVTGLFDLPLRQDTTATGVVRTGPYGYSEQSPYVWTDPQMTTGRNEDGNRGGTTT